jgi:hypothetical protein
MHVAFIQLKNRVARATLFQSQSAFIIVEADVFVSTARVTNLGNGGLDQSNLCPEQERVECRPRLVDVSREIFVLRKNVD